MPKLILSFSLWVLCAGFSFSASLPVAKQDSIVPTHNANYILHIRKLNSKIALDGVIDEPGWADANVVDRFRKVLPVDTGFAVQKSEIRMAYDDKALYLAIIFRDTIPGKRVMESFKRDFLFAANDNFLTFIDTYSDQTNGYSFGISASGAKWDGVMSEGAASNLDWDCKWESKIKHYPDKWVAEMRIPFKSIRYPSQRQQWNINFSRQDLKSNEKSAWAPMPRQFSTSNLAYTGVLKFESPLPEPKMQFSLIPYLYAGYSNNYEKNTGAVWKKDFGFDAKIGLSTSLNLDLTYNPDFAQVEVDQQVTNIERFELYFPEKRRFFLENNDLFANFGAASATPFFSRRIGLDAPVLTGARLSGKIGNNFRIGLMNMTTQKTADLPARNYTVASVQQKIFARSNAGFIFVDKEYLGLPDTVKQYNRVAGLDINLASRDNIWSGKYFYHRSFRPGEPDRQFATGMSLGYKNTHLQGMVVARSVGDNYLAETGYVKRSGYNMISPEITYLFVPNKKIVSHGLHVETDIYYNSAFSKLDHEHSLSYMFNFRDQSVLSVGYLNYYVKLTDNFDPTHRGKAFYPAGNDYNFGGSFLSYISTRKTLFNWYAQASYGTFYDGKLSSLEGRMSYRFQPYVNVNLNFHYTDIHLPTPFERTKFWLIGPKVDVTFTDKIFLSSYVQYNQQSDNMNVNVRFQWRYMPVSDFFIVYTDNFLPGEWLSRNRALVFKITCWIN